MKVQVLTTAAQLADASEMAGFLAPISGGDQLAKLLAKRKPVSTRAYEDATQTARFVESDGNRVMCFTIAGITIDQAEMIEAGREVLAAVDELAFRQVVDRALNSL